MKDKYLFLSGVNGLRTIAALSVVISHIALSINKFNVIFYLFGADEKGNPNGWYLGSNGVTLFFVLSGFLITYLLLLESKKNSIDIKKFYIRRILRIWPIYYLYLFLCLAIIYFIYGQTDVKTMLYYIFFTANIPFIFGFALLFLDHFWSIGVEEQFYLFWPWIIKKAKKYIQPLIIGLIIVINIIRYFLWWKFPYSENAVFSIVNRFDCMMIGGLGAIYYESKNKLFLTLFDNKFSQIIAWIALLMLAFNFKFVNAIVDTTIVSVISLILIIGQINIKNRIINLDLPIFNFLGKISYGIYVYHVVLIYLISLVLNYFQINDYLKASIVYIIVIGTTIIIAYISYEFFESPFIRLKDKFSIVKSTSSKPVNENPT